MAGHEEEPGVRLYHRSGSGECGDAARRRFKVTGTGKAMSYVRMLREDERTLGGGECEA